MSSMCQVAQWMVDEGRWRCLGFAASVTTGRISPPAYTPARSTLTPASRMLAVLPKLHLSEVLSCTSTTSHQDKHDYKESVYEKLHSLDILIALFFYTQDLAVETAQKESS
jgi:hypothetical protein